MATVCGRDVMVGDTVDLWWGRQTVVAIRPYTGALAPLWDGEARVAEFASGSSMTLEPSAAITVLHPAVRLAA